MLLLFPLILAPSPTSVQLTLSPDLVFAGTSPLLTCTAIFSRVVGVNLTVTTEFRGPANVLRKHAIMRSVVHFVSIYFIPEVTSYHTGKYNCSVVSSGSFLVSSPSSTSNSIDLVVGTLNKFLFLLMELHLTE